MTVEIDDGTLLGDLIDALTRGGCHADRTADRACRVVHPLASTKDEAVLEVAFFLRAWQLRHPGVAATLTP
jgi:hypothetical protein